MNALISQRLTNMKTDLLSHVVRWHIVAALALLLVSVLPALSMAKGPDDEQLEQTDTPSVSVDETDPVAPPPEQSTKPEAIAEEVATPEANETAIAETQTAPAVATKSWFDVSDDQLASAEARAREVEAELLRARARLDQLRFQRRLGELRSKLLDTEQMLAEMFSQTLTALNEQASLDADLPEETSELAPAETASISTEAKSVEATPAAEENQQDEIEN